jgi:hypothetical protein
MLSRNSSISKKSPCQINQNYYQNFNNNLVNLYCRDLGILSPITLIQHTNTKILDDLKLSKFRCVPSSRFSINWFDLDNVENRL